jgi:ribosomal protein L37AE/L43A
MNRLPKVLRLEIWEYVRGDRAYWKEQFAMTLDDLKGRGGSYTPDPRLKQAFIDWAIANDWHRGSICPFCGTGHMHEANGNGYWACETCDQIAAYCVKCQGWMNYVDFADYDDDEELENVKLQMPRSTSTKLATADRIRMETCAILCWKCEKCGHVASMNHW